MTEEGKVRIINVPHIGNQTVSEISYQEANMLVKNSFMRKGNVKVTIENGAYRIEDQNGLTVLSKIK